LYTQQNHGSEGELQANADDVEEGWTLPVLRSYMMWIRHRFQPTMTCSAELVCVVV